ncbi:MAG: BlaI/MecI/CopY family transcriptional regulator [Acidobacteriota bacterium]|nr:BlaI/MecI/CopY family transcriptional regulator [Acidobacteriota bacterium]
MKKNLHELTDLQLSIMQEVWRRGTASVTDVHEALIDSTGLAKKTVGTMMARLEKQGFLAHRVEGREFIYEPTVTRYEVGRAKVRNVLDQIFAGNLPALVSHALEAKEVAPGDVERVRSLLGEWEKKEKKERK